MCIERVKVVRFHGQKSEFVEDVVIQEVPFTIYINNQEFITLTTIPQYLKELTFGFLKTEGIIEKLDDIDSFFLNEKELTIRLFIPSFKMPSLRRVLGSGCGASITFYRESDIKKIKKLPTDFSIASSYVASIMKDFQMQAKFFTATGGVHGAALSDLSKILYFCEDVGRHNAVDKIVGKMMLETPKIPYRILLTTGRISSEILRKALMAEIPIIISRSAPTLLSIREADRVNITLIGFARGERFNVYTGLERIE